MAKVSFSALLTSISGKLAGSVFQFSLGGYQIRSRTSPRDPKTNKQQKRRGSFSMISYLWDTLSPAQIATWNDNAPSGISGKAFFNQVNMKLQTAEQTPVLSFQPSTPLAPTPLTFVNFKPGQLSVSFANLGTTVPAGQTICIFATKQLTSGTTFINETTYVFLQNIPPGTSIDPSYNLYPAYQAQHGNIIPGDVLGLKIYRIVNATGISSANEYFQNYADPA